MEDSIAVYVHGCDAKDRLLWYRIVLETSSSSSSRPALIIYPDTDHMVGYMECENHQVIEHHPVAVLTRENDDFGLQGGWAVIGDDIYWAGGYTVCPKSREFTFSKNLLKHNMKNDNEEEWEKVCTLTIPRRVPSVVAIGGREIAIVGGFGSDISDLWTKTTVEVYDLEKQTSHYLNSDITSNFYPYGFCQFTSVVEDNPTQIVLYFLFDGSMLFLGASTGEIVERRNPDRNFAIWSPESPDIPRGLEGCSDRSIESLHIAVGDSTPVFLNRTMYFFAPELRLYAYDLDLRKWFQSECLVQKLHLLPIRHLVARCLVCLPNGNLLVMVSQVSLVFTMASLSVSKAAPSSTTLDMTVEHIQCFSPRGPHFFFSDAKAARLNNAGSDIMEGVFTSATET